MSGRSASAEARRVEGWTEELTAVADRIGGRFVRAEPRRRAVGYVRVLLGDAERKNGWQLAEALGEPNPDGVQRLLARADWDADAVRDDLGRYVAEHLGDRQGVLIVDETGFLKKGVQSVGVARQYSGTAGRIENCQIGVFLGYATTRGRTLLDRSLYLPNDWAEDADRRKAAGVPAGVRFSTKIVLAKRMVERALDAGARRGRSTRASRRRGSPATRSTGRITGFARRSRTGASATCSACGRTSRSASASARPASGRCCRRYRPGPGGG
jgi:SRSO17 transposase